MFDYSSCVTMLLSLDLVDASVCLWNEGTGGWWFLAIVIVIMAGSYFLSKSVYTLAAVSLVASGAAYVWMPVAVQMAAYLVTAFSIGAAVYVFFAAEDGN